MRYSTRVVNPIANIIAVVWIAKESMTNEMKSNRIYSERHK